MSVINIYKCIFCAGCKKKSEADFENQSQTYTNLNCAPLFFFCLLFLFVVFLLFVLLFLFVFFVVLCDFFCCCSFCVFICVFVFIVYLFVFRVSIWRMLIFCFF